MKLDADDEWWLALSFVYCTVAVDNFASDAV